MELTFPLILDGATGTELQKHGFGGGDCPEAWTLEHPDAIREIQQCNLCTYLRGKPHQAGSPWII